MVKCNFCKSNISDNTELSIHMNKSHRGKLYTEITPKKDKIKYDSRKENVFIKVD